MKCDGFKLKEGRFRPDIRKKLFTPKVRKQLHRLPREVAKASFLKTFLVRLDRTLSNMILLKMSLLRGHWTR